MYTYNNYEGGSPALTCNLVKRFCFTGTCMSLDSTKLHASWQYIFKKWP